MSKIIININHQSGRPLESTKSNTAYRDGYIIKAYFNGFRRKHIADMMGISYTTVCKAIKKSK